VGTKNRRFSICELRGAKRKKGKKGVPFRGTFEEEESFKAGGRG